MIVCPWSDLKRYAPVIPGLEEAMEVVAGLPNLEPATYPLSNGGKIMVQVGKTKPWAGALLEVHHNYLDIQYVVKGEEVVGWAPTQTLTLSGEFDTVKDKGMYGGENDTLRIREGYCYVVYPEDAHAPGKYLEESNDLTKIVVKLKL